jgi:hypothetical protein
MELRKVFFDNIPVKEVDEGTNHFFQELIERIIQNKHTGVSTKEIENELDNEIFELYNISESEKETVLNAEI